MDAKTVSNVSNNTRFNLEYSQIKTVAFCCFCEEELNVDDDVYFTLEEISTRDEDRILITRIDKFIIPEEGKSYMCNNVDCWSTLGELIG